jgi:DsbC/DsbD-like thiol-disulfide interchange protein
MHIPSCLAAFILIAQLCVLPSAVVAADPALATGWASAENSRVRLVGGRADGPGAAPRLVAGLEIEIADGWKTYWRNPGSSGVPPRIDWSKSVNLASARVLFPAPARFVDRDGDTIGYKGYVVFPIELVAKDAAGPVELELSIEYGICKDICIPVELNLALSVPPGAAPIQVESRLARALGRVPRPVSARAAADPAVTSIKQELTGEKPRIVIAASFPAGTNGADLFAEAPDGLWVPLPKKTDAASGNALVFEIDLTDGADIAELKGKTLRLTLVSNDGQSETAFKIE